MSKEHKAAWQDFVRRFGGTYDGVSHAAKKGSAEAQQYVAIYENVAEIVDEVADEHDVEGVWDL